MEAADVKCSLQLLCQDTNDILTNFKRSARELNNSHCTITPIFRTEKLTSGATRLRQSVPVEIKEPCATYQLSAPVSLSPTLHFNTALSSSPLHYEF